MDDTISRREAVNALKRAEALARAFGYRVVIETVRELPSAQQEQPSEIQDILNYLDTVLHPIISPEHWGVYSDLHDMISTLPSSEPKLGKKDMPEQGDSTKFGVKTGKTCAYWDRESNICALHRPSAQPEQTDCDYCHENINGFVKPIEKNCHAAIHFDMYGWHIALKAKGWAGRAPINFCPMCGRRLKHG